MSTAEEATHSEQTPDEDSSATETEETSEQEATSEDSELEKKYAAAAQEAARWKGRLEKLQKTLLDEQEEKPKEKPQPKTVTSDDIAAMEKRLRWELKNEDAISLAQDEYDKYIKQGYKQTDALRLAHLDKGITASNMSEHLRQKSSSSAPSSVDRSGGEPGAPEGISEGLYKKLKAKGRTDEQIRRYVERAKQVQNEATLVL